MDENTKFFSHGRCFNPRGTDGFFRRFSRGDNSDEWKAPLRDARKKNPFASDDVSVSAGKALYMQSCFACHGVTGKGDGPAAVALQKPVGDLSNAKMFDQSDGTLFWKVTTGRAPMPAFATLLTDEQRWNIVNFVRTLALNPQPRNQRPSQRASRQPSLRRHSRNPDRFDVRGANGTEGIP